MGCGASKEDIAAFEAMREKCDQLELDRAELEQNVVTLEKLILNNEVKSKEQLNLYRFKIEVMANMLSVEEKKLSSAVKRLDTLKLAMLTQGFSDKAMNTLLRSKALPGSSNSSKDSTTKDNEQNILMTSAFDLSGAISRLSEEMEKHPEDVIYAFANKQGKLLSHISRDDFSRYLFNVTESLTKADVQILSLRFYDGSTVCVPEFIDFFTSSSGARVARAAASAVRVSLNMLQLEEQEEKGDDDDVTEVEEMNLVKDPSTNMKNLQHSVDKLIAIWDEVEESLIEEFMNIEEEIGGNQIVQFDTFEDVLDTFCGEKRAAEERKQRRASGNKWLTNEDINFVACRFEIGDRIDVKSFFNFFQDAFYSSTSQAPAATPFQFSREWSSLRHSAQKDLIATGGGKKQPVAVVDVEEINAGAEDKRMKLTRKESKPKVRQDTHPKPSMTREKSEKRVEKEKEAPTKPPTGGSSKKKESKDIKKPPPKVTNNTLVALYAANPEKFESKLEDMSSKTGFIMTKEEFRVTLQLHTKDDNISDSDLNSVLNKLKFIGGTCSVSELVDVLAASVAEAAKEVPPVGAAKPSAPLPLTTQGPFINIRQEHILETLADLQDPSKTLDTISVEHQKNPKVFLASLKEHAINNNTGVVDGTGNSITSASFNQVLRIVVPDASQQEVNALETDLQPSIREGTNDILLTAITATLKQRAKDFNSLATLIKKQEKLLAAEEKRNVRIEDRTAKIKELTPQVHTDSISDHYFLDSKLFMTTLKNGRTEKSILMTELLAHLKDSVPNVTKDEIASFQRDFLAANAKLNGQDKSLHVTFSAVEKLLKQRISKRNKLLKQIENEKKHLQKDVDIASTVEGGTGGCCGGSGGNVHDPNSAPQDIPPTAATTAATTADTLQKHSNSDPPPHGRRASPDPESDSSEQEDLPRYNPNSSSIKRSFQTGDSLAYSEDRSDAIV